MDTDEGYLLGNRQAHAGARLEALATLFDPTTFRLLDQIGVAPGWRCWCSPTCHAATPRSGR